MSHDIEQRKGDHIDLCAHGDVGFHAKTTLFECVSLLHDALPDLHADEVNTSTVLLGKALRAPILIAAMTGGTPRAREINRELARIAEERGYGFGVGSQRAMHLNSAARVTYETRAVAPTTLVLGNIGVVQARDMTTDEICALVADVRADALCVHMNPAMEVVQPGGDRDFRGGAETFARLVRELRVPVVAKETGCGLSPRTLAKVKRAGVTHVDVSGAGGTSWVAVETHRAGANGKALGEAFWEWGVPTAASVVYAAHADMATVIATGGVKSGLDIARAIALGAHAAGVARPVLRALIDGGVAGANRFLDNIEAELRAAMLLVGAPDLKGLRMAPRVISGELRDWMRAVNP